MESIGSVGADRFVPVTVHPSWQLAVALVVLVALAAVVAWRARLGVSRAILTAAARAALQLVVVSGIIVLAISQLWSSLLFVLLMFVMGVHTTTQRTGTRRAWPWVTVSMAAGVLPVLLVIFGLGVVPFNGLSIIPIAGIITGNTMTAHTLLGRRLFPALRDNIGTYEAALSLGLLRTDAIDGITRPLVKESLVPALDQTRTVGLVTRPGAYIGVLLGGGSALQAGAAQLLVLVGIVTAQVMTVTTAAMFMRRARLLPHDLVERLRP